MADEPSHVPVLPEDVLRWLDPQSGDVYLDGTLGLGGHALLIGERVGPQGRVIGLDRDPAALERARVRLSALSCPVNLVHTTYSEMQRALDGLGVPAVDRILLDIGVSSLQLDTAERGFSFRFDAPLDMRMDPTTGETAEDLLARLPEVELANLIYRYGEERFSRRIAKRIVESRLRQPITSTKELADLVAGVVPRRGKIHPATRVFQALRIAVNDELGELDRGLVAALDCLRPGGRLVVLSFHSLEDRLVKQTMRRWHSEGLATLPSRKAVKPAREECLRNPRARSTRLRVCQKPTALHGGVQ